MQWPEIMRMPSELHPDRGGIMLAFGWVNGPVVRLPMRGKKMLACKA